MQSHHFATFACLGTLLLLGCQGESPTGAGNPIPPDQNFTNGPPLPGPIVFRVREPDWFVFLFPDLRANLTAQVGMVERFSVFCSPDPITIPPQDLQFLFKPGGQISVLAQGRDMPVLIYEGAIPGGPDDIPDFCAQLATAPIIARGTARFVFNHQDLTADASNGYRAQGTVDLVAGGKAHFNGVVKFVSTPDGGTRVVVSQVILSPIGR